MLCAGSLLCVEFKELPQLFDDLGWHVIDDRRKYPLFLATQVTDIDPKGELVHVGVACEYRRVLDVDERLRKGGDFGSLVLRKFAVGEVSSAQQCIGVFHQVAIAILTEV